MWSGVVLVRWIFLASAKSGCRGVNSSDISPQAPGNWRLPASKTVTGFQMHIQQVLAVQGEAGSQHHVNRLFD
jgi:hypothetical protein